MSVLLNLSGGVSSAMEVNDLGHVAGWSKDALGNKHAVKWLGAGFAPIVLDAATSADSTEALAINDAGRAVGFGVFEGDERAMVFDQMLGARRLDEIVGPAAAGWTFLRAQSINAGGEIVGFGTINGQTHAFVASPVPEPATLLAFLTGVALLARRRRRNYR
jgi:hypothetical protein